MGGGPTSTSTNADRPVFLNATVIFLFVLPMVTMRTTRRERSGTMELLLTAPRRPADHPGKFLGAMGLFTAMLALSLIHIGVVFWRGNPEPLPILTTYLGLLLMGGCFVSLGLLISSLTRNQIVAGMATFGVFLMLWVINWIASFTGPTTRLSTELPVDHRSPGRLHQGHHRHEAPGLLHQLHRVRPVPDRAVGGHERWRGVIQP